MINGTNDNIASALSCGSGFPESPRAPEDASTLVQMKIAMQMNGTAVKVPQIMTLANERSNNIQMAPTHKEKRIANKRGPMLPRMAKDTDPFFNGFDYLVLIVRERFMLCNTNIQKTHTSCK
jgi:hypothetical protein